MLADVGLVEQVEEVGAYRNTALGATIRADHPSRLRDLLLMQATLPNLGA